MEKLEGWDNITFDEAIREIKKLRQSLVGAVQNAECREEKLDKEIKRLNNWINDLQKGMYINCVYCGHRYGPDTEIPASMADVLKEHIEKCPRHPLFKARQEIEWLRKEKEWLINEYATINSAGVSGIIDKRREYIIKRLQQAQKEE